MGLQTFLISSQTIGQRINLAYYIIILICTRAYFSQYRMLSYCGITFRTLCGPFFPASAPTGPFHCVCGAPCVNFTRPTMSETL